MSLMGIFHLLYSLFSLWIMGEQEAIGGFELVAYPQVELEHGAWVLEIGVLEDLDEIGDVGLDEFGAGGDEIVLAGEREGDAVVVADAGIHEDAQADLVRVQIVVKDFVADQAGGELALVFVGGDLDGVARLDGDGLGDLDAFFLEVVGARLAAVLARGEAGLGVVGFLVFVAIPFAADARVAEEGVLAVDLGDDAVA